MTFMEVLSKTTQRLRRIWGDKPEIFSEFSPLQEVYVIRHGSTAWNSDQGLDLIRGWRDVPLSAKGLKEARRCAQLLKFSNIKVLEHSGLYRTRETAKEIARTTGARLIINPKLKPWDVGIYTGEPSSKCHPIMKEFAIDHPDKAIPGGESFNQFRARAFDGVKEALERHRGKLIGLVTHHRVERLLVSWIRNGMPPNLAIDLDEMFSFGESPGSAEVLAINPDRLRHHRSINRNGGRNGKV